MHSVETVSADLRTRETFKPFFTSLLVHFIGCRIPNGPIYSSGRFWRS